MANISSIMVVGRPAVNGLGDSTLLTGCVPTGVASSRVEPMCALAVYFAGVAEYLDESAVAAADHALVRALRVLAGACAISGFAVGMYVLTRRDEAIPLSAGSGAGPRTTGRLERSCTARPSHPLMPMRGLECTARHDRRL